MTSTGRCLIVGILSIVGWFYLLLFHQTVMSSNEALKRRVEAVLDMAVTTVSTLSEAFSSGVAVTGDDAGLTRESIVEEKGEEEKAKEPIEMPTEEVPKGMEEDSNVTTEVVAVSEGQSSEQ